MAEVTRKGFKDKNGQKVVIVPNVQGATEGNLASFDENGNLQDRGKKPSDFAESSHIHPQIANDEDENAVVRCGFDNGAGKIEFSVQSRGGDDKVVTITYDNVDNLNRALKISRCNLVYDNNVWKLSNAAQTLEEMNLDEIKYCIFEIKPSGPSGSITYYAFGSLSKTWEVAGQGVLEVQVAVLGHLLSWSDQVQAEGYHFVDPMTLSVQSTNLFPTT